MIMRQRELEFYKRLLLRRLDELYAEAKRAKDQVKETDEPSPDPFDQASNQFDRDFLLRLKDRERKLMEKIQEALERIENGTFGICVECGGKISQKRLHARPVATLCIDCKNEQESLEKRRSSERPREAPSIFLAA
jgi:DnaK suppressor protein